MKNLQDVKDKIQRDCLNKWYLADCKGSLELATGIGKSRCGILASEYFAKKNGYDYKILIITPTTVIRDSSWVNEFKAWGSLETFNRCVRIECINTVYKWKNQHFDLVIVDRILFTLNSFNCWELFRVYYTTT